MKKALILYGSTTGNTESMAELIKDALGENDVESELKDVSAAEVEDLTSEHDLLVLGCPAYGDDTIELQEDFEEYYEKWDGIKLDGKKVAVFAPGDSTYEYFCGTVDFLEECVEEMGGNVIQEGLKIDGDPSSAMDEIADWSRSVAGSL